MTLILRLGLAALALVELVLGVWTAFFPRSFYELPTIDLTPPFSEHFMRDFGGATLGIAVVLGAAAIWPTTRLVVVALLAYLAFAVPHFVFHAAHLEHATASEATQLIVSLVASVALPIALLVLAAMRAGRQRRSVAGE